MKLKKKILLSILFIVVIVFTNGVYYVFHGQLKSAEKISRGKELSLYECCSIYTMHTAVWLFGWPLSPEAAEQAFLMTLKSKPRHRDNGFFLKSELVKSIEIGKTETLHYKSTDFTGKERRYALALDRGVFHNSTANQEVVVSAGYGNRTDRFTIGPVTISLHYSLLRYIQDRGWIHKFTITYTDPRFQPI